MNPLNLSRQAAAPSRESRTSPLRFCALIFLLAAGTMLTGCFGFLKPARSEARYFVLTPVATSNGAGSRETPVLGIGRVKMPAYLDNSSLAVRRSTNEVEYSATILWGERLDEGFQRVLGANLAALMPTAQIRQNAWNSREVNAEIYVGIERFDLDRSGEGVLVAAWRIVTPGGEKTLKAGEGRFSRQGVPPDTNPGAAVDTLSELTADFSRLLADALRDLMPSHGASAK